MEDKTIVKKVKENLKKKRKKWYIKCDEVSNMNEAFISAESLMNELTKTFSDDEKEKYYFLKSKLELLQKKIPTVLVSHLIKGLYLILYSNEKSLTNIK